MLATDFAPGSPNWLDLGSPATDLAAAFYGGVFGWDFLPAGPDAGGYGFLRKEGRTVAALGPLLDKDAASAWTVYFHTPDAIATAKAVEQGGGTVRVEPFDVFDNGRMAQFTDPGGADFAVWQPGVTPGLERVTDPGALCWVELHTKDPAAARGFYRSVFGWRYEEVAEPGMTYTVLATADGGRRDTTFGGMAPLQQGHDTPRWLPYFEVEDVDTVAGAVRGHGGSVSMPPVSAPGIGRLSWLEDPFGAPFAVIRTDTPAA
ncbi:VOC family protein [Streptomyces sp. URMC 123]|uniref:VOC family protein n=1 Tax=Streptomyces sp. URMC 123 TaxID=3423403 RepID=UPI003F1B7239